MIIVRITMNALPEKQLEVTQTLVSMIEPTDKEAGCLSCAISCDIEKKNRFILLEEWRSREDMVRHITSPRFGVLSGTNALLSEPMEILISTVSQSEGMETVYALRKKTMR